MLDGWAADGLDCMRLTYRWRHDSPKYIRDDLLEIEIEDYDGWKHAMLLQCVELSVRLCSTAVWRRRPSLAPLDDLPSSWEFSALTRFPSSVLAVSFLSIPQFLPLKVFSFLSPGNLLIDR